MMAPLYAPSGTRRYRGATPTPNQGLAQGRCGGGGGLRVHLGGCGQRCGGVPTLCWRTGGALMTGIPYSTVRYSYLLTVLYLYEYSYFLVTLGKSETYKELELVLLVLVLVLWGIAYHTCISSSPAPRWTVQLSKLPRTAYEYEYRHLVSLYVSDLPNVTILVSTGTFAQPVHEQLT